MGSSLDRPVNLGSPEQPVHLGSRITREKKLPASCLYATCLEGKKGESRSLFLLDPFCRESPHKWQFKRSYEINAPLSERGRPLGSCQNMWTELPPASNRDYHIQQLSASVYTTGKIERVRRLIFYCTYGGGWEILKRKFNWFVFERS